MTSCGWPPETAVTVPCANPVGTAFSPAVLTAAITASGAKVVAMSMSSTGWPITALRTQPPTKRAQPDPPAASSAAITARVCGALSHD